jgi:uncharacterized protein YbgA (DUF1722 family)
MEKIKLGITTCLLGENVRYDGGHKLDRFLTDTLGQYVEYIPLIVPTTLMNHYVRKYGQPYLKEQVYLNPHPLELPLRNHV